MPVQVVQLGVGRRRRFWLADAHLQPERRHAEFAVRRGIRVEDHFARFEELDGGAALFARRRDRLSQAFLPTVVVIVSPKNRVHLELSGEFEGRVGRGRFSARPPQTRRRSNAMMRGALLKIIESLGCNLG